MRRACLRPGCPGYAVPGGRGHCPRHRQSTAGRGYGAPHRAARQLLPAPCAYGCGTIVNTETFVAAHVIDRDRGAGLVAACAPCNERAKGDALRPMLAATIVSADEPVEHEPRMRVIG